MGALEFASNEYSTNLQTTINPESVRPYDIVVGASTTQLHLTATTYTNVTGGDTLRTLYMRAQETGGCTFTQDATGKLVTVSIDANNLEATHMVAELLAATASSTRIVGGTQAFYDSMPWKAVAYYNPTTGEKGDASHITVASLNPWGINEVTFKYLRNLGGWKTKESKNVWHVPANKIIKLIQSNQAGERGIAITRSIAELMVGNIDFDGKILSLQETPVKALNFAKYDTRPRNSKREKGKTLTESLTKSGYGSVFDVLYNRPNRYLDLSNPATNLYGLMIGDNAYITGKINSWTTMNSGKGAYCHVQTADTEVLVTFWGPSQWRETKYPAGTNVLIGGKVSYYKSIALTGDFIDTLDVADTSNPYVPIYAQSPSRGITTDLISNLLREALTRLNVEGNQGIEQEEYWAEDTLPEGIHTIKDALQLLHFPQKEKDIRTAIESLAWYELVRLQVIIQGAQKKSDISQGIENGGSPDGYVQHVISNLPYSLTGDQQTALKIIQERMADNKPMDALLSADVGSGKTIVQILAALNAVDSGRQAVIVAPTDILAKQIHKAATVALEGVEDLEAVYLSGSMKAADKKKVFKGLKEGDIRLVVGTHTVLTAPDFDNLGFVCFDEQQKFGVEQRERLTIARKDGTIPDFLTATATPTPRTVAQMAYGQVEFIQIKEKPAGRKPVETEWVPAKHSDILNEIVHPMWCDLNSEIAAGHQAFIIAPRVEETSDAPSVTELNNELKTVLPTARIGVVHGKMKVAEQEEVMNSFRNGELDVLIASTIIEVGVDVPGATRIVIMGAERLGASSLHQLRGRVGRNDLPSKCWLVTPAESKSAQARMNALVEHSDGFAIAEADTVTRGEGDILTQSQHGTNKNRFLRLNEHRHLIPSAIESATRILTNPTHGKLALQDAEKFFDNSTDLA